MGAIGRLQLRMRDVGGEVGGDEGCDQAVRAAAAAAAASAARPRGAGAVRFGLEVEGTAGVVAALARAHIEAAGRRLGGAVGPEGFAERAPGGGFL